MKQPKYTCKNCESEKEPYFSRSEPMGFYCQDCGQNSDQLAVTQPNLESFKADLIGCETKKQLSAERALADRLADSLNDLWDNHTMYGAGYEVVEAALTAWKEARGE